MRATTERDAKASSTTPAAALLAQGGRRALTLAVLPALLVAALAWSVTARSDAMGMPGAAAFVMAWLVMMVAMMLPAVAPVAGLYVVAARRGVVAAAPVFLSGYLVVWALTALPAYVLSGVVSEPLMDSRPWVARLVGATLVAAGVYQVSPLKRSCLRACRSPMSFFLTRRGSLSSPSVAFSAGVEHGLFCLGCCWALMAVLVVLGGMQLGWALALALIISAEKLLPGGEAVARATAGLCLSLGAALLFAPSLLVHLIHL
jgi:predicted metal-binding membrane protein